MKLIEGIKELKIIEKRINKNCQQISDNSAYVSDEQIPFESQEEMQAHVQSLVQANLDLEQRYLDIKTAIEKTNLETTVDIQGKKFTISELISLRRIAGRYRTMTYQALNGAKAVQSINSRNRTSGYDATNPPKIVPLYNEKDKQGKILEWEELLERIDPVLEVVNAETELKL